ncbi:MAG: hypothetical protein ABIP68_00510 [Ferruginibacter sp.]
MYKLKLKTNTMGFFDKMKSFVGVGGPVITFTSVEDNIHVTDTGIKFNISVASENAITVKAVTGTLKVTYKNDAGEERTETLGSETDNGEHWGVDDNPFPGIISKDQNWDFAGSVYMDDEKSILLQELFSNKSKTQLKVILNVEVDVKETGGLFDPSVQREITLH